MVWTYRPCLTGSGHSPPGLGTCGLCPHGPDCCSDTIQGTFHVAHQRTCPITSPFSFLVFAGLYSTSCESSQVCRYGWKKGNDTGDKRRGLSPHTPSLCSPGLPSPLISFLLTGSPGHTGSTSMSPSAALSTGKPMDSHPSYTDTPVSAPRTLSAVGTPLNALGSPYRVITSAMGPPSGALAAPPGINLVAPPSSQVGVHPFSSMSFQTSLIVSSWC